MADFTALSTVTAYATLLTQINDRLLSLAKQLDDGSTNLPADAIRFNKASKKWQKWSGSAWVDAADIYDITVSANNLLTQLLTVDGASSGLDADKLDGYQASAFLLGSAYTAADVLTKLLTVDGAGSGLDADKLDGQEGSYYRDADKLDGWHASELIPPGTIAFFARNTAPAGWLKINGAALVRANYTSLDAAIYCGDANNATALWGYRCNNADGSSRSTTGTYLMLPDLRGEFTRGWDDARGVDSGRSLWSAQGDELKSHSHVQRSFIAIGNGGNYPAGFLYVGGETGDFSTQSTGGAETRPRNLALLACIKY